MISTSKNQSEYRWDKWSALLRIKVKLFSWKLGNVDIGGWRHLTCHISCILNCTIFCLTEDFFSFIFLYKSHAWKFLKLPDNSKETIFPSYRKAKVVNTHMIKKCQCAILQYRLESVSYLKSSITLSVASEKEIWYLRFYTFRSGVFYRVRASSPITDLKFFPLARPSQCLWFEIKSRVSLQKVFPSRLTQHKFKMCWSLPCLPYNLTSNMMTLKLK